MKRHFDAHPVVFWASAALIALLTALGALSTKGVSEVMRSLQAALVTELGWLYLAAMVGFFLFALWLGLGPHCKLRLGGDGEQPEFNRFAWLAMLFSAGMGIGLLFYGVAEPVLHFAKPPVAAPRSTEAARQALTISFFHWGLHPWGVYAVVALALGYFGYRHGEPLTLRSLLSPLLGRQTQRLPGDVVDTLATVSTMFGVATSLGVGATQINAGLKHVFGLPQRRLWQLLIIAAITAMATASVVSGLKRGVRRLSELNVVAGLLLLLFVLAFGPTGELLLAFGRALGEYVYHLPAYSVGSGLGDTSWRASWTVFYWAWWIAWSPFVGMFIARISRGRTFRELVLGTLAVPTGVTFLWMTVFGQTALHGELHGAPGLVDAVQTNVPTALFVLLERLPAGDIISVLAVVCIASFFVTSSDSASLVIDIITSGGNDDPPVLQRLFWAISEGSVAALLLLGGGLKALQTMTITSALPFTLVLLAACAGLARKLDATEV